MSQNFDNYSTSFFDEAKKAKYLLSWPIYGILCWIFMNSSLVISISYVMPAIMSIVSPEATRIIISFVATLLNCGAAIIVVKFIEKRSISSLGLAMKKNFILEYLLGVLIGFGIIALCTIVFVLTGNAEFSKTITLESIGKGFIPTITLFLVFFFQGAREEIIFRGWLMTSLGAKYGARNGIIMSSAIFSLVHILNPGIDFLAGLNIALAGLFFAIYAAKAKNLWGVCGAHAAWNWTQGNFFGYGISGSKEESASLIPVDLTGNRFITGGDFGPEASVVATIILIILITFVAKMKESSK